MATIPQMNIPGLQETLESVYTNPLNQFDPGWQKRATASGMTADSITGLVSSFASSGDAAKMFQSGVLRSQKAGSLIDDLLAGRISSADQAGLSQRSAENAQSFGLWGGAKGGAARGLEARDLGLTQMSLQQMGLKLAGTENNALNSALGTLGAASDLDNKANQNSLSMQLAKGAIGVSQDWMGMSLQMQAANLNAAARFQAGQEVANAANKAAATAGTGAGGVNGGVAGWGGALPARQTTTPQSSRESGSATLGTPQGVAANAGAGVSGGVNRDVPRQNVTPVGFHETTQSLGDYLAQDNYDLDNRTGMYESMSDEDYYSLLSPETEQPQDSQSWYEYDPSSGLGSPSVAAYDATTSEYDSWYDSGDDSEYAGDGGSFGGTGASGDW